MTAKKQKEIVIPNDRIESVGNRITLFRNKIFELIEKNKEGISNYEIAMGISSAIGSIIAANTVAKEHVFATIDAVIESLKAKGEE